MFERLPDKKTAIPALVAAAVLAGCSSKSESVNDIRTEAPPSTDCIAKNPDTWTGTAGYPTISIAKFLGVSVQRIENGSVGPASCDDRLTFGDGAIKIIKVEGKGEPCMFVGVVKESIPSVHGYKNVIVLCAAPEPEIPIGTNTHELFV